MTSPVTWTLLCRDCGTDCPAAFTSPSSDELMQLAGLHLAASHPGLEPDDTFLRRLMAAAHQTPDQRRPDLVPAPR